MNNETVISVDPLAGLRESIPGGPNSFNFMQFLGNLAKSYVGAPLPPRVGAPPRENPGSATGLT